MADTDIERMQAQFDADISRFEKKMDQLGASFDRQASQVEARNKQLVDRFNSSWSNISVTKLLGAVGGAALLDNLIDSSKQLVDTTLNVSKATGISAEDIQGLGIVARKAGVDQDTLTTSLEHFAAQVGEAQLKNTDFSKVMTKLGIDLRNGPQAALMSLSDEIGRLPKAQQAAVAQMAFGRAGVSNLAWLTDGSKNIQDMIQGFQQMGLVIPADKLQKVNDLFDAWADLKLEALSGFMDGFSAFAGEVGSPAFETGMEGFGRVMGDFAGIVVKIAPYLPQLITLFAAARGASIGAELGSTLGPEGTLGGTIVGGLIGGFGAHALVSGGGTPSASSAKPAAAPSGPPISLSGSLNPDNSAQIAARIAELNRQLDQQINQTVSKGEDAYDSLVKAQNDALEEQTRGTAAYYDVVKNAIIQEADLDIQKVNEAKDNELQAIRDRQAAQIASTNALKTDQSTKNAEINKINAAAAQEEVNTAATAADQIATINAKKNAQLLQNDWQYQQNLQNQLQIYQELRDGISDVAAAGLTGFKNMTQAAGNFLEQLAQLILKLYVIQPLLNSVFGPPGTVGGGSAGNFSGAPGGLLSSGGGLVNSFLNLFGAGDLATNVTASIAANPFLFADGGVFVPGKGPVNLRRFANGGISTSAAIFGEDGVEAAVPLPDGRSIPVTLRVPNPTIPSAISSAGNVSGGGFYFDLRGAVMTQDLLDQMNDIADRKSTENTQKGISMYDRNMLPGRVKVLNRQPRRAH